MPVTMGKTTKAQLKRAHATRRNNMISSPRYHVGQKVANRTILGIVGRERRRVNNKKSAYTWVYRIKCDCGVSQDLKQEGIDYLIKKKATFCRFCRYDDGNNIHTVHYNYKKQMELDKFTDDFWKPVGKTEEHRREGKLPEEIGARRVNAILTKSDDEEDEILMSKEEYKFVHGFGLKSYFEGLSVRVLEDQW